MPLEASTVGLIDDQIRMRRQEVTAGLESLGKVGGGSLQRVPATDEVERFATHDQLEAAGKPILGQVEAHEADVLEASAAFGCPIECSLGNVGGEKGADTRGELHREVAFRTGKF